MKTFVTALSLIFLILALVVYGHAATYAAPAIVAGFGLETSLWGLINWGATLPWWAFSTMKILEIVVTKVTSKVKEKYS